MDYKSNAIISSLTLCMMGNCMLFLLSSAEFFKINFFKKFFQEYHRSWQIAWIHIRPDVLSGLISGSKVFGKAIRRQQNSPAGKELNEFDVI